MAVVAISHRLCRLLFAISFLTSLSFLFWSRSRSFSFSSSCRIELSSPSRRQFQLLPNPNHPEQLYWNGSSIDLLSFSSAWNLLSFPSEAPPHKTLKLALFVKRWPRRRLSGGLERHALTLHLALARRGHEVHVFTTSPSNSSAAEPEPPSATALPVPNLTFHLTPPTKAGYIDQPLAWAQFQAENARRGGRPFDAVHTESVALRHGRARNLSNLAASWHGIAYETIHSDVVQELLHSASPAQPTAVQERLARVVDEVRFFRDYAHHVATSDHVGDVLRRVYMIPEDRVHVIVNGVDDHIYRPDPARGDRFRREVGVPDDATSLSSYIRGRQQQQEKSAAGGEVDGGNRNCPPEEFGCSSAAGKFHRGTFCTKRKKKRGRERDIEKKRMKSYEKERAVLKWKKIKR